MAERERENRSSDGELDRAEERIEIKKINNKVRLKEKERGEKQRKR